MMRLDAARRVVCDLLGWRNSALLGVLTRDQQNFVQKNCNHSFPPFIFSFLCLSVFQVWFKIPSTFVFRVIWIPNYSSLIQY